MFNPSQQEVRQFFCTAWRKHQDKAILTPLEAVARDWIVQHPEYTPDLSDPEAALSADYSVERAQSNPFLHLAMHLSITEQVSIDQPPGIRAAFTRLSRQMDSEHDAQHVLMECLGQMLWTSQRSGLPPDADAYLECIRRHATQR